jgi:curved DNA-binding protein CbpA
MIDYYEILEISPNASLEIIRGAYKILLHRYNLEHETEDRSETQKLNNLNLAYEVLSDPDKREVYDAELQKVKQLHQEAAPLHQSGNKGNATTQNLPIKHSKLLPDSVHSGDKQSTPSLLNRVKWSRWGWSISVLAVLIVLISMVQPDPEKALRGQFAVDSKVARDKAEFDAELKKTVNESPPLHPVESQNKNNDTVTAE